MWVPLDFKKIKLYSNEKKTLLLAGLFFAINTIFIIYDIYYFSLLPIAILILYLSIFRFDYLFWILIFCTPLSINLFNVDAGLGLSVPTEPILFGMMIIFFIKLALEKSFDKRIIRHPITIAIIIYLIWILFTSITSEIPVVSFKFFLTRLWFIVSFFFIATQIFKRIEHIYKYFWLYFISFSFVIIYSTTKLLHSDFTKHITYTVMHPFYNDHTAYGAALAMMIPVFIGFIFNSAVKKNIKYISGFLVLFLITATIFSYSRAAWLSLIIALIIFLIIYFRINFKVVLSIIALFIIYLLIFPNNLIFSIEKNNQDSSLNLAEHVQSMSNIKSDASNLERLNRWSSAMRMFHDRPFTGWGPGTYQFLYAPYQLSREKTIISTDLGDNGNAHSEYIGPLSESGIFGLLTFLAILITVFRTSIKIYKKSSNSQVRNLVIISLLGLVTYYTHGFLNNFLDTDKASALFWGFIAIVVSLDVYYFQTENISEIEKKI